MNSGALAQIHNVLQTVVILQRKGNGNLIHLVLRKNVLQISERSQNLHPAVQRSARNMIIQNAVHNIAPLRIGRNAVQIGFRRSGIANQNDML